MGNKKKVFLVNWKMIISVILTIAAFSTIFFSGALSKETEYEKIGHYASQVVNQNTINKKYCALTVESTKESGAILDHHSEFHNLYGSFRQTKITFASMVNVYHDYDVRFDEIECDNLSIFYLGPDGSIEYNGHFKHYIYPFEFMFAGSNVKTDYKAYISESHAKQLLIKKNTYQMENDKFSKDAYLSLLGEDVPISVNGKSTVFKIQNIYYETNYYYEGIKEVAGNFFLCSYSLPDGIMSNRKNIYFLSEYDYQNSYFMKYINESYNNHKYVVRVSHNNVIGSIDDSYLTSFYKKTDSTNVFSYLLVTLSIVMLMATTVLSYLNKEHLGFLNHILIFFVSIVPYLIFLIISNILGSITFFSGFSTKVSMFSLLGFYLFYFLAIRFSYKKPHYKKMVNLYEIDI